MSRPSKKEAIVAAAIRLMSEGGPEALTASALARAAGVSKANIFHHFARLDDIVVDAFEMFLLAMPSMQPEPGTGLRDWLLALGAETSAHMDADPALAGAYMGFIVRARGDGPLRARVAAIAAEAEARFEAALALLAPGRFSAAERRALAGLILLTGDGLALHRQLFPERAGSQAAAWRAFVDSIAPEEKRP
jgi:Uncharacterized protein conserved in bacteria